MIAPNTSHAKSLWLFACVCIRGLTVHELLDMLEDQWRSQGLPGCRARRVAHPEDQNGRKWRLRKFEENWEELQENRKDLGKDLILSTRECEADCRPQLWGRHRPTWKCFFESDGSKGNVCIKSFGIFFLFILSHKVSRFSSKLLWLMLAYLDRISDVGVSVVGIPCFLRPQNCFNPRRSSFMKVSNVLNKVNAILWCK